MSKNLNEINVREDYKNDVLKIWNKFKNENVLLETGCEYRKHPLLPETVKKNCLMFIGMNPSFTKDSFISDNEKNIGFYSRQTNEEIPDIPYFEKIKNVARYCETKWTHLDLFFMRETSQKVIEKMSYKNVEFLSEQLKISFDIIKRANPELIIVSNALASEFFGKMKSKHKGFNKIWKGFTLIFEGKESTFNSKIGTYEIELNNKLVPVIFSGMLSGQRALDIGSFERLKWHAKMIMEGKRME